ncbi:uncharacterized protein N7482_009281 [Penicillium canariense]|uniref:Uncharacterized protein n=1 Tax=Penicillium canariense TaxID=189055 RepID=A0A9W9HPV2_9EURO|nr:uncharacterized protein N7482_009281 [Penicillium canariense]KAJ5152803.1 hypothetical protein N7482_009281 [Penicillium canariense]
MENNISVIIYAYESSLLSRPTNGYASASAPADSNGIIPSGRHADPEARDAGNAPLRRNQRPSGQGTGLPGTRWGWSADLHLIRCRPVGLRWQTVKLPRQAVRLRDDDNGAEVRRKLASDER